MKQTNILNDLYYTNTTQLLQGWGKHQITIYSQALQWLITSFTTMQCKQETIMHTYIDRM